MRLRSMYLCISHTVLIIRQINMIDNDLCRFFGFYWFHKLFNTQNFVSIFFLMRCVGDC